MLKKRFLFSLVAFLLITTFLIGCSSDEAESQSDDEATAEGSEQSNSNGSTETVDPEDISEFSQSPVLDEQDLPPVEERLPEIPKVTNEMDASQMDYEIGEYGGTLSVISASPDLSDNLFVMLNEPLINTPGLLGEEFTGNVVESFEVSEDETTFTFNMRKGLKWSDGEDVNTEDVQFTYEDVYLNEELTPSFPAKYRTLGDPEGNPMDLEILDDYTFKITFDQPYGGFLMRIAIQGWEGYGSIIKPEHYLKQFHKDYASEEELAALISDAGYEEDEWFNLFHEKDIYGMEFTSSDAIGFPTLNPWQIVENSDGLQTYERNPYYFKVDSNGNQLPYIDGAESIYVQDKEMENLEIISGNVDYVRSDLSNVALYRENEDRGNYKVVLRDQHSRPGNILFNHNFDNEAWQSVISDVRFREALSLAINNEEVIDAIYLTFAEIPSDYNAGEYNLEKANQLLDEIGMDQKDSEGFRLAPNGEEFQINIEVFDAAEYVPQAELLVEYWNEIGIRTTMRTIDSNLWDTRKEANEIQVTVHRFEDYWWQGNNRPDIWGPEWNKHYESNGQEGTEPTADALEFLELANIVRSDSAEKGIEAFEELQEMNRENLYFLVTNQNAQQPQIVNKDLGNIPDAGTGIAMNFSAEQFFFRE